QAPQGPDLCGQLPDLIGLARSSRGRFMEGRDERECPDRLKVPFHGSSPAVWFDLSAAPTQTVRRSALDRVGLDCFTKGLIPPPRVEKFRLHGRMKLRRREHDPLG